MSTGTCTICGRPCRGNVHAGHCHDVYYGREVNRRRKQHATGVREVALILARAHEYVAARRAAIDRVNKSMTA